MADLTDAELGERLLREVFGAEPIPESKVEPWLFYGWLLPDDSFTYPQTILAPERIHLLLAECERRRWTWSLESIDADGTVFAACIDLGHEHHESSDTPSRALALAMLAAAEAER